MINLRSKINSLYIFDRLYIGYSILMVFLILVFGRPLNNYLDEILFYLFMLILAFLIIRFVDEKKNRFSALIRLLYPLLLFTFFYTNTGGMMLMIFDHFFDAQLTSYEYAFFGVHPTQYIDRNLTHLVWANDLFSFGYFSYFLMFPTFFLIAFLKKDDHIIVRSMSAMCLAFYVSYLFFILIPVESPRWFFSEQYINPIKGFVFRPLVELFIDTGGLHGGAMPSSHVAVALVMMFFSLKYYPRLGKVLIPFNILLAAGTVWGRFHYVSDVVAGIILGVLTSFVMFKYYARQDNRKGGVILEKEFKADYVS